MVTAQADSTRIRCVGGPPVVVGSRSGDDDLPSDYKPLVMLLHTTARQTIFYFQCRCGVTSGLKI